MPLRLRRSARPLLAVLLALAPAAAGAQPAADSACVVPPPRSAFTRVPVLVYAEVADPADRGARGPIDLIAQEVAERLRAMVWNAAARGAVPADAGTTLPPADSVVEDRALATGLRVVARRDGSPITWRMAREESVDSAAADTVGAALLAQALDAAVRAQAIFIPEPAFRHDSLVFALRYTRPDVPRGLAGATSPVTERNPSPAFSLEVPWVRAATLVPGTLTPRYPVAAIRRGYVGQMRLRFVVGADGRAEAPTVHDVWPADVPPLTGRDREAYDAFVVSARRALVTARFQPALRAGCPMRQLVELPMAWSLNYEP